MTHPEAGEHPAPRNVEETSRPSALRRPMEAEKPGDGDLGSAGSVGPGKALQRDPQVLSGQVRPRASKRVADRSKGSGQLQRPAKRPAAADGVGVSSKESKGKGVGSLDRPASALPPEKVQKLRDELQRSKAKLAGGGPPDPPPEGDSPDGEDGSGLGSSDYTGSGSSGSAEEAGLGAGTLLTRDPTRTPRTLHQKALSGGTSEGFHEQLIRRAAGSTPRHSPKETDKDKHNNEKKESGKESGKHRKRGHSGGRKSDKEHGKKEKKKEKKKKKSKRHAKRKKKERKKKKTKVTLSDGRIISCLSSSSNSSRTPSSTEDEKALEAPLKKKSLKEPGSVLNMLLEHISVQLQQNAEVDTPVTRHGDLTSGVKVMTYLSCIDHQATVPQSAQGDEGVAHVGIDNRPSPTRTAGEAGRRPCGPAGSNSSEPLRRILGFGQAPGGSPDAGRSSVGRCGVAGGQEARQAGHEGTRRACLLANRKRSRKRKLVEGSRWRIRLGLARHKRKRKEGQERKRKGKEGQGGPRCRIRGKSRQVKQDGYEVELAQAELSTQQQRMTDSTVGLEIFANALANISNLAQAGCFGAWLIANADALEPSDLSLVVRKVVFEHCWKPQVTSKKGVIFPLRAGDLEGFVESLRHLRLETVLQPSFADSSGPLAWQVCARVGVNALCGGLKPLAGGRLNASQTRAAASIAKSCGRVLELKGQHSCTADSVEQELKGKRVSYTGEELGTCHPLTLDQVIPGLPPVGHGGSVDVLDLVSRGTSRILQDPSLLVLPDVGQELPPLQARVHCPTEQVLPLCKELVRRNICSWTRLEDVFHYRNQPVLSGLFGVEKPTVLPDGRKVLTMDSIRGAVRHLPSITAWLGLTLGEGEGMALFQSDLTAAFYLFRLPKVWQKYLAFNIKVRGSDIDMDPSTTYVLSCSVLPMGWSSSVSIMQEVAEQVALLGGAPVGTQLVRGRALPTFLTSCIELAEARDMPWWHVYLDNFCAGQKILPAETDAAGQSLHDCVEDAWARSGLVSSAKKKVSGASKVQELGAWLDGESRMISVTGERLLKLLQTTLWTLSGRILRRKVVQIVIGRWVHVLQFRRPGMIVLEHVWDFISGKASGPRVVAGVRRELWTLVLISPFLHCNLGATIDTCTTASDASTKGGAVGISHCLSQAGMDFVMASKIRSVEINPHPILVISLFNGIAGCFRVYDILNIQPIGLIAVELYGPANRIVQKRWPQVQLVTDVRNVDSEMVHQWMLQYPMVEEIHLWAGFPCTDLCRVRAFRQGLQGPASSLVFEIP